MPPDAKKTINEIDKAKRLQEEADVLADAAESANNPEKLSKVMLWQTREIISFGGLLREVIDTQGLLQPKADCAAQLVAFNDEMAELKKAKKGMSWPTAAAIIAPFGMLCGLALRLFIK